MKTIIHLTRGAKSLAAFLVVTLFLGIGLVRAQSAFTVNILYPTNDESFNAQAYIPLHAVATDSNTVNIVQFFSNGVFIGGATNPFSMTWSNVPAGSYTLTALATDSAGNNATSAPVNITVGNSTNGVGNGTNTPAPPTPFTVNILSPANGSIFQAPASIPLHSSVTDSNAVESVQYFANTNLIGTAQGSPFVLTWSGVPAGSYTLTAVATDVAGNKATSADVNITVGNGTNGVGNGTNTVGNGTNASPTPFTVNILSPANGSTFQAPASIPLHSSVVDTNAVGSVQYFANTNLIGTAQGSPFVLTWSNVPVGNYTLTAVATDAAGNKATSADINITVSNGTNGVGNGTNTVGNGTNASPTPFTVNILSPANGSIFQAPASIPLHSSVVDTNAVESVQYFANTNLIGTAQGSPFVLTWSSVPAGSYTLTAVATDSAGNNATSTPVNITVGNGTNGVGNGTNTVGNGTNASPSFTVNIFATDPVAVQGTNCPNVFKPLSVATNFVTGTNTATFLVHRNGGTNGALTVYYSIHGTASNGVDYAAIPNFVTIPNSQANGLVTIVPLGNTNADSCHKTVILALTSSTNVPPTYLVGLPSSAGAVILGDSLLPIVNSMIQNMPDCSLHISLPATNGMNFCLEVSTNLFNWVPVCTNTVLKGSAQYVEPNGARSPHLYYRIVPVSAPATY